VDFSREQVDADGTEVWHESHPFWKTPEQTGERQPPQEASMSWSTDAEAVQVVLCTVADAQQAALIARLLVEERLAACGNIIAGLRSIYRWQGKICDEPEVLLILKTAPDRVALLAERIKQLHSYQNPEVLALPIGAGLRSYLDWVHEQTRPA
jgi:periplasmic divalent cation tolerance protein